MSTPALSSTRPDPRDILGRAWPLFKASLPVCLPLAVIGVAAGATPGAESVASGEGYGLRHGAEWWGVTFASVLLTLICYGAVLRQQLSLASGRRVPVMESLRAAAVEIPAVVGLLLLLLVPVVPAMLATAALGFGWVAAALTVLAASVLVFALYAWAALVEREPLPWKALGASIAVVRSHWRAHAMLLLMLLSAVAVFVLLVGIFVGVIMGLAGQSTPTAGGLAFSRWLMAVILAMPIVYGGAVTVTAWRDAFSAAPATPDARVTPPAA